MLVVVTTELIFIHTLLLLVNLLNPITTFFDDPFNTILKALIMNGLSDLSKMMNI